MDLKGFPERIIGRFKSIIDLSLTTVSQYIANTKHKYPYMIQAEKKWNLTIIYYMVTRNHIAP